MIYRYNQEFDPPAPVIDVTIKGVVRSRPQVTLSALIDTGSDFTAVPKSLVEQLDLYPLGVSLLKMLRHKQKLSPFMAYNYIYPLKI